jgi:hypothetical protein
MMRVTEVVEGTPDGRVVRTLRVEGALRGEWVAELRRAWSQGEAAGASTRVELADVPFVDAFGKHLLADMHKAGVEIVARGLLCEGICAEIVGPLARIDDARKKGGRR